jgi:hypothetical protein
MVRSTADVQAYPRAPDWRGAALWIGLALLVYAGLYPHWFAGKALSHDDLALFVTARDEGPVYWLSQGYSAFFELAQYPFIRPVSHALMWFDQQAFGTNYGLYFLPFFGFLGLGAWAGAQLAAALGLGRIGQSAIGLVLLLQPAWVTPGLLYITFQQDALAGIFSLMAALACVRRRWLLAALLLLLAPFTKEIALFAPIAAALWALLWLRSWRVSLLLIAPLLIWGLVRVTMVGSVTGGTYVTSGATSLVAGLVRGLAIWPTGFAAPGEIKALAAALGRDGPVALAGAPMVAATLALNLLLDALVAVAALGCLLRLWRRPASPDATADAEGLVLIWTLGALGLVMLVAYELRFAGALHPVLLLLLARLTMAPPLLPRLVRPLAGGALLLFVAGLAITSVNQIAAHRRNIEPAAFAALTRAVAAVPPRQDERILVLNAPVTGPAPRWQMAFWNRPGTMHTLNRAHGCLTAPDVPPPQLAPLPGGRVRITLENPACANILVLWAQDKPALAEAGASVPLGAGVTVDLAFPQAAVARGVTAGAVPDVNFGRLVVVELNPADFSRILVRDWQDGQYRALDVKGQAGP